MNNISEIRRCAACGAMIEVLEDCKCTSCCGFTCCGKEMQVLKENTSDGATEKHVPVITPCGSVSMRRQLRPGEPPEAFFEIPYNENLVAREYCNKHGLWKNK